MCAFLCLTESRCAQVEHVARTNPELHGQLLAVVRERGSEAGSLLPAGLVAAEPQDGVANNMQAQSDYLRDMVVRHLPLASPLTFRVLP